MSDKRVQLSVGIFSMLALGLLAAGIARLAGGAFFSAGEDYVLHFQGAVTGLNVGAPVVFRGVPLGKVSSISLMATEQDDAVIILVGIDIDKDSVRHIGASGGVADTVRENMLARMVERGLRARITTISYLTGQARVDLDFFPETPARYYSKDHSREIPTLFSPLEEFSRVLAGINIGKIANSTLSVLESLSKMLGGEELQGALISFRRVADEAAVLAQEMPALAASAGRTLQRLETAADNVGKAAERADTFFLDTNRLTSPNAAPVRDLQNALKELAEAARAMRSLANTLERNPESLLRGKGRQQP